MINTVKLILNSRSNWRASSIANLQCILTFKLSFHLFVQMCLNFCIGKSKNAITNFVHVWPFQDTAYHREKALLRKPFSRKQCKAVKRPVKLKNSSPADLLANDWQTVHRPITNSPITDYCIWLRPESPFSIFARCVFKTKRKSSMRPDHPSMPYLRLGLLVSFTLGNWLGSDEIKLFLSTFWTWWTDC